MNLSTSFQERIEEVISNIELENQVDNTILKNRFLYEVMLYEKKRYDNKSYYNKFRFIVTTGSILLPAILSIGQMDPNKLPSYFEDITYWASWTISLAVTISNGFLQLFSIDKQNFEINKYYSAYGICKDHGIGIKKQKMFSQVSKILNSKYHIVNG